MKPKDLKRPFSWENRAPALIDKVLFVPTYYNRHREWIFPHWSDPQIFGKEAFTWIEYCSGNGSWVIEKAAMQPECNWIAVERKFERVKKIWSKMKNRHLENLMIVYGEALTFTQYYLPSHALSGVYVNFPDPWPKSKHAKNRLLQEPFLSEMSRVCREQATATIVTDHADYADEISSMIQSHPDWTPVFPPPYYVTEWNGYGSSYFDELWRQKGKQIRYLQFCNSPYAPGAAERFH